MSDRAFWTRDDVIPNRVYIYLLTYFDHTASQAIGTEMHAYTVGFVHAIELR